MIILVIFILVYVFSVFGLRLYDIKTEPDYRFRAPIFWIFPVLNTVLLVTLLIASLLEHFININTNKLNDWWIGKK